MRPPTSPAPRYLTRVDALLTAAVSQLCEVLAFPESVSCSPGTCSPVLSLPWDSPVASQVADGLVINAITGGSRWGLIRHPGHCEDACTLSELGPRPGHAAARLPSAKYSRASSRVDTRASLLGSLEECWALRLRPSLFHGLSVLRDLTILLLLCCSAPAPASGPLHVPLHHLHHSSL